MQTIISEEITARALSPNSTYPRAFLRWAGSKRFLLKHVVEVLPPRFEVYREPFLGSGSLYFTLCPERAVLSDICGELIETFCAIKDNVDTVLRYLAPLKVDKEVFYQVRGNRSNGKYKSAAEFIYLNKACWNGLYRVNAAGHFNVPFGKNESGIVVDPDNLKSCAKTLRNSQTSLLKCNFEDNLKEAKAGDLVYLDPPYVTGHNNNGFIEYNETIFSWDDQIRLAKIAAELMKKGVYVIVSNADHDEIVKLYSGFHVKRFERSSTLASDVKRRRRISEVLFFPSWHAKIKEEK